MTSGIPVYFDVLGYPHKCILPDEKSEGVALRFDELEQLKINTAKSIFAGFCLSSKNMEEKEILCRVIDKLHPELRLASKGGEGEKDV